MGISRHWYFPANPAYYAKSSALDEIFFAILF
jgi:hypothetical protein